MWVVAAAAILAVFAVTRLALLWRFPPFTDETAYAVWTWEGFRDAGQRFVSLANGKEPLLPWLGMVLMWLGASSLTAVRLVSLLSGIATLVFTGLLGRELGGTRVGLAAAGLYAVLPFFVVHDVIGIYDPLATATVTAALYLQIRLARQGGLHLALLLGIALAAGLLTKQTTYVALALLPTGLLVFDWSPAARVRRLAAWAGGIALALLIAYTGYSLMKLSEHWNDLAAAREALYPTHSIGAGLDHPLRWLEHNWPGFRDALSGYLTPPLVVLFAVGTGLALRRRARPALIVLAWGAAPIAAAVLLVEVPYPRYLLTGIPPLVVLMAYGAVAAAEWLAPRFAHRTHGSLAVPAAAAAVLFSALVFDAEVIANPAAARYPGADDVQYATGPASGAPWVAVAKELRRRAAGHRLTVVLPQDSSYTLGYLLRDNPNIEIVSEGEPPAVGAAYGIENGVPLRDPEGARAWREVWGYLRPRGGTPLRLFESGVLVNEKFYARPDDLRAGLGLALDDAGFDAFIGSHPDVLAWYQAWYEHQDN